MPPTEGRDALRERLALLFNEPVMHLSEMTFGEAFGDQEPDWVRAYGGRVDAILAEIEREHVIVPVDRWNRAQSVTANLRAEFDCAAGDEGCSVTDGELLDQALLALEALEEALGPGDGEAPS